MKNAYAKLSDEVQRNTIILHVENAVDEAKKERRKLIAKGVRLAYIHSFIHSFILHTLHTCVYSHNEVKLCTSVFMLYCC